MIWNKKFIVWLACKHKWGKSEYILKNWEHDCLPNVEIAGASINNCHLSEASGFVSIGSDSELKGYCVVGTYIKELETQPFT